MVSVYATDIVTPIGKLALMATDQGICHLSFGGCSETSEVLSNWCTKKHSSTAVVMDKPSFVTAAAHPVLQEASCQLEAYFTRRLQYFDLPLFTLGTPFQLKVWEALRSIPFGETSSYKEIAEAIGQPGAMRAVGGANNRNPISIIVPCHRVIGANGNLIGYGGGLNNKKLLLELERMDHISHL